MIDIDIEEFNIAKWREIIPCVCDFCFKNFLKSKRKILHGAVKTKDKIKKAIKFTADRKVFCSGDCHQAYRMKLGNKQVICKNCATIVVKQLSSINKNGANFCSQSCAGIYNTAHKTKGNRRSKLEVWLEQQLFLKYPKLVFHFNRRDSINSELDIYLPELKLAFE